MGLRPSRPGVLAAAASVREIRPGDQPPARASHRADLSSYLMRATRCVWGGAPAVGSSLAQFRSFGFQARDGHLELWLRALAYEIDHIEAVPQWLKKVRDHWHLQGSGYFNGWISPNLDRILQTDGQREIIRHISCLAFDRLVVQGPELSRQYLDSVDCDSFGAPLPAQGFVQVGQRWLKLLGDDCQEEPGDAWNRIQRLPPLEF
jgi:hypothetical protein